MAEELFKGLQTPAPKTDELKDAPKEQNAEIKAATTSTQTTTQAPANTKAPAQTAAGEQTGVQKNAEGTSGPSSSGSERNEQVHEDEEDDLKMPSEIDMLKDRAKLMGIPFSNNIGVDALKEKIREHQTKAEAATQAAQTKQEQPQQTTQQANQSDNGSGSVNAFTGNETKPVRPKSLRQHLRDEKMKQVRVRITNLDPKKKDLPGEILTIANEYLGTVRKFVPFGEVTDNGYHVPQCLYDMMKERTFVSIKTRKDSKGQTIVEHQNAREFALEILPQLTPEELAQLSAAQAAAGGL